MAIPLSHQTETVWLHTRPKAPWPLVYGGMKIPCEPLPTGRIGLKPSNSRGPRVAGSALGLTSDLRPLTSRGGTSPRAAAREVVPRSRGRFAHEYSKRNHTFHRSRFRFRFRPRLSGSAMIYGHTAIVPDRDGLATHQAEDRIVPCRWRNGDSLRTPAIRSNRGKTE